MNHKALIGLVFLKKSTNTLYQVVACNKATANTQLCLCMNLHEEVMLTFQVVRAGELQESSEYFFCNKERDTLKPTAISPVIMKLLPGFARIWLMRANATVHDVHGSAKILSVNWKTNEAMVRRNKRNLFGFTSRKDYLILRADEILGNYPLEYSERMFEYIRFNLDIRPTSQ